MKISYLDLLMLLKENKHPKRIKLYICKYSEIYVFNEEYGSYLLEDETKVSQRFNFYLNENLTDISSLNKNIKIIS